MPALHPATMVLICGTTQGPSEHCQEQAPSMARRWPPNQKQPRQDITARTFEPDLPLTVSDLFTPDRKCLGASPDCLGEAERAALTLPSETHTSWFCCCWIASFSAPYQPSFIEFRLIVAGNKWRHRLRA